MKMFSYTRKNLVISGGTGITVFYISMLIRKILEVSSKMKIWQKTSVAIILLESKAPYKRVEFVSRKGFLLSFIHKQWKYF